MITKVDAIVALSYSGAVSELDGVVDWHGNTPAFSDAEITAKLGELETFKKLEAIKTAIQSYLDATAQSHGYDSILTAVTYVDSPVVKFHNEAISLRDWRANCWDTCYTLLAQWQAEQIAEMSPAEVVASMPVYTPPE
jgi:hypothetical protein